MHIQDFSFLSNLPNEKVCEIRQILIDKLAEFYGSEEATKEYSQYRELNTESFWSEFGWDICQGTGEAVEYAESISARLVTCLPDFIICLLWAQTIAGSSDTSLFLKYLGDEVSSGFDTFVNSLPRLLIPAEDMEISEIVAKSLLEPIRSKAEEDYSGSV